MAFEGRPPKAPGPTNRHGMPKLPVGQRQVPNWPVLDLGDAPIVPLDDWRLEVGGRCENPFTSTWEEFLDAAAGRGRQRFPLRDDVEPHGQPLEGRALPHARRARGARARRTHVLCTGYDHMPGTRIPYTTNLPLARAVEDDVLLVHTWEGAPLPQEHGGPCRMITPKLYAWKGTKWIRKIEFLPANKPGFWEERGYSDTAEPGSTIGIRLSSADVLLAPRTCGRCWRRCRRRRRSLDDQGVRLRAEGRRHPRHRRGRCLGRQPKPSVRFWSRNGNEKTAQFPDIVDALGTWLKKITAPVVLDGEIVALDEEVRPAGFQRLQHRIHVTRARLPFEEADPAARQQPAAFIAFDLLRDGDDDLRDLPLTERRERLEALFTKHTPPSSTRAAHRAVVGDGTALLKQARRGELGGLDGQARAVAVPHGASAARSG